MRRVQFLISKIRWRFLKLWAALLSFEDTKLTPAIFQEFVDTIFEELRVVPIDVIKEVSIHLLESHLDKDKLKNFCWFISSNYTQLKSGDIVLPSDIPLKNWYYLFQIINSKLVDNKYLQFNVVALSGNLASNNYVIRCLDPTSFIRKIIPKAKFVVPIQRFDLFDGLFFVSQLELLSKYVVRIPWRDVYCKGKCASYNKTMFLTRAQLRYSPQYCYKAGEKLCRDCKIKCEGRPKLMLE